MKNPKTTIAGYALLVTAAAHFVHTLLVGGDLNTAWLDFTAAAGGVGLVNGQDGGH